MLVDIIDDHEIAARLRALITSSPVLLEQYALEREVDPHELARVLCEGRGVVDWVSERPRLRREVGL